jgi:dATP pyrophosphohydrolase
MKSINYKKNLPIKNVKSVGAVVLNARQKVLLVFQKQNRYWEFPKGKVEIGEEKDESRTLKREIFEETGLKNLKVIKDFKYIIKYQFILHGHLIHKDNIYYLGLSKNDEIILSDEHLAFKWVSLQAVSRYLKHKNQRILIYKLREFLKNNPLDKIWM